MTLGQPDTVEAPVFSIFRGDEGLVEGLILGAALPVVAFHHQSQVHKGTSVSCRLGHALPPSDSVIRAEWRLKSKWSKLWWIGAWRQYSWINAPVPASSTSEVGLY